jgi:hypothetical protein
MTHTPAKPQAEASTVPDSGRLGVVLPRLVRRPDVAGWWYDTKTERWRWCFEDPGMGFCARESKSDAGHFWKVSNYKPESNRWYGPWGPPNDPALARAQKPSD